MSLNTNKTKELLVYFGREDLDIPRITINGDVIERVSCAKLLGCHIVSNLSWEDHIVNLVSKTSRRLHLLRELKRAGLSSNNDLLTCYFSFVRSKTEYACQVWSTALTIEQSHAVETIQRRAMQIISPNKTYEVTAHADGRLLARFNLTPTHRLQRPLPPSRGITHVGPSDVWGSFVLRTWPPCRVYYVSSRINRSHSSIADRIRCRDG